ncbi:MAG: DNA repair protein RadA [Candidatus Omnitrophica bacterium]|nr:DNA repair protein RadA [Candidatus Omnitrophota bacterium]
MLNKLKKKIIFVCQECGGESPRWLGKCPNCSAWNSFVEESTSSSKTKRAKTERQEPVLLTEVSVDDDQRYVTDIRELDNVLGGGIVPGSVCLIGGDPGIGKSTLSLQMACALSLRGHKTLYVSGEESVKQTGLRAKRLTSDHHDSLYLVSELDLDTIEDIIQKMRPDIVIIDSIQVIYKADLPSSPGSVSQVRECSSILTHLAKSRNISLIIIGHVTKEGMLAGPRVLEHIVDTVLYFEGERYSTYRILRATKNRFGATNEIGVFEMTSAGLVEVPNPSEIFLSERPQDTSGSVVVPIIEGTRPFLVEIQGLVSRSSFGMVRQKAQGFDANRLALLIAVLEKRLQLNLQDQDVFLNVVGGVRVMDPAADLGVALAIASAYLDKQIPFELVVFGEIGLSAEIRSVSQIISRLKEAEKLGFKRCLVPKNNLKTEIEFKSNDLEIVPVSSVKEALEHIR